MIFEGFLFWDRLVLKLFKLESNRKIFIIFPYLLLEYIETYIRNSNSWKNTLQNHNLGGIATEE